MHRLKIVALLLVVLAGCSNPPTKGKVEWKQHSDAVTYLTTYCTTYSTDRYRRADGTTYTTQRCIQWGTHANYIPAEWKLCLKGPDQDGKIVEGCVEVGVERWHRYAVGDFYDPAEAR